MVIDNITMAKIRASIWLDINEIRIAPAVELQTCTRMVKWEMIIRFFTQLADKAGTKELELKLEQDITDVRGLLNRLAKDHSSVAGAVLSQGDLAEDVYILINGRHISALGGLDSLISDSDVLVFVPVTEAG